MPMQPTAKHPIIALALDALVPGAAERYAIAASGIARMIQVLERCRSRRELTAASRALVQLAYFLQTIKECRQAANALLYVVEATLGKHGTRADLHAAVDRLNSAATRYASFVDGRPSQSAPRFGAPAQSGSIKLALLAPMRVR